MSKQDSVLRITDIRKATINGRKVKLFRVFRFAQLENAYLFDGQYSVPQKIANKNICSVFERCGALRESYA